MQSHHLPTPGSRPPYFVPDESQLSEPNALMKHLLEASAYARGTSEGVGFARLLEAAAKALQQTMAEAKVQRGLAIASQTLATELALRCEQLQSGGEGMAAASHMASAAPPPPQQMLMAPGGGSPMGGRACCSTPMQAAPPPQPAPQLAPPVVAGMQQGFGPPPGGIGLASGLGGVAGIGGLYPMPGAPPGAAVPMAENDAGGANSAGHGGLSKTWAQAEQPGEPWGGSANQRPLGATMSAASGTADAEAERSIDAMVFNLRQRFKQSGVTLPLEKQTGAVYRLGSRKLQLSIRNSRLTVRVGSNFIDFLEYLSKAAL